MDPIRAWLYMGMWQKFCFFFLFIVTAITIVRVLRLTSGRWLWRERSEDDGHSSASQNEGRRRSKRFARSTSGLAQTAFWFTCSGAAAGLGDAWRADGATRGAVVTRIAEFSFGTLAAVGVGLALCSLLFAVSWIFDEHAWEPDGGQGRLDMIHRGRRLLVPIAILLTAAAFLETPVTFATELARLGEGLAENAVIRALGQLLSRLSMMATTMAFLTWLSVLAENAVARRLRPA